MTSYVALLRAVNVGGSGKLPMATLVAMCEAAGFENVSTYNASGNVVFSSALKEAQVRTLLEARMVAYAGRPVAVLVRTTEEMNAIIEANPFRGSPGDRTVTVFLNNAPAAEALNEARGAAGERMALGMREIYVAYGERMADSRLVIPAARAGTARNMNTVVKLATMASRI